MSLMPPEEWDSEAFKRACDEAVEFARTLHDQPPPSPEMLELARRALDSLEARKDDDVEEWARRLGEQWGQLSD